MKIHKLIEPENVFLDLSSSEVASALASVTGAVYPAHGLDTDQVRQSLIER